MTRKRRKESATSVKRNGITSKTVSRKRNLKSYKRRQIEKEQLHLKMKRMLKVQMFSLLQKNNPHLSGSLIQDVPLTCA